MFSLSGKSKNQIPCFPCAVATLQEADTPLDPEADTSFNPEADTPPPTEFLTHACENIIFPQLLLRTVKMPFKNGQKHHRCDMNPVSKP